MLDREDEHLIELLGRDTPEVRALIAAAGNGGLGGAVHEMLRSLVRQRGWDPDNPPAIALPWDLSPSDYPLGLAMSGDVFGEPVGPSDSDLMGHLGVFGQTGTGKTTVVRLLLLSFMGILWAGLRNDRTFLVWDAHSEYRDLLRFFGPEGLVWLEAGDVGVSPFEVPRREDGALVMHPYKWLNCVREWARLAWLNEPSLNLLCEVVRDEYERRGLLVDPSGDWPSVSDILGALQRLSPPKGSDRARAKDKLLDRLESIRAMLPGLDVRRSRDVGKLLARSVILDLSDTADLGRPLLFALLTLVKREVLRSDEDAGIHRLEVIEEAHELLGGQMDRRVSDLKESTPSGILRDLRKTGTCGVVVTQLVSDLAPSVRGNLGSVLVLRQGNRDSVRQAAALVNLKTWYEDEIAKLPNCRAIARFSRHGEPVYLAIYDARALGLGVAPPSREEAREFSRAVLEAIPYVKGEEPAVAAGDAGQETGGGAPDAEGGLHPRDRKVLARIAERPWERIEDRMDALGLDREVEGDVRTKLEARGLIGLVGNVGAKNRLFELTDRGRVVAEVEGLAISNTGKGSAAHEAIVQYAQRSLAGYSSGFRFQRAGVSSTTGGVQPDLLLLLPGGGRVPIQACCNNQPSYEAGALLRLHALALLGPGHADRVDAVLAVCVNRRHKAAIERALRKENGGRMPDRVVLLDFDTMVDPEFDWASVLESPL